MGSRRRIVLSPACVLGALSVTAAHLAMVAMVAVTAMGCHHDETLEDPAAPSTTAPPIPVDHLAPGELIEGTEKTFGIVLPRQLSLERQFVDVSYASGDPPQSAVATYFSTRVTGGKVTTGDRGAIFEGVHTTAEPARALRIEVATASDGPFAGRGSRVTIRDITAPQLPEQPDEAARWKAAGLKPDGTLADPQHAK